MEENKTVLKIALTGRIDSANALQVEKDIRAQLDGKDAMPIELDASGLEYISSSGLRVILRLRKQYPDITITGVSPEVYEILEMTGFTEMMKVIRSYRSVSQFAGRVCITPLPPSPSQGRIGYHQSSRHLP